ncbi:putative ABC transport system permease protein [Parasphingorhabdus marina DSM 22363]|uniref:Putative ABC transport system permease protein n=1 Tax=Parasphingorhabdus marina DSM 22363 TaxID=1123272 RepID=A0A1N6EI43_9SPHN|nr:FtsX-like permease family protein [Parasphingorhabdus marina]SIN82702.1 putative ABC transport system permease protein [Parasphingorhabdus marina DSM 22363]
MLTLAIAYLRDRPLTTILNVLLLAISVAMLVLLLQFGSQFEKRFEKDAEGVDLVVGAKGSPLQLILSSVFHIDQPTGNIPLSSLELLRGDPATGRVIPLALGDNFEGYRIVGTDETFLDLHQAEIAQGAMFEAPMQAIMGASVAAETGADLGQQFIGSHGLSADDGADTGHDHAPFETVGVLAPTGTVIDRLILTSVESVWDVHGIAHDHDHDHGSDADHADHDHHGEHGHADDGHDHAKEDAQQTARLQSVQSELQPELTALLVSYRNASGAIRIPAMINRQTEMQAAVPAVETARLLSLLGVSLEGARIFAWLLAAIGGLAIFVALFSMARSREGDLALLRVMGATRRQLFSTILLEGLVTAAAGAALGWLLAHSLLTVARNSFATMRDLGLSAWQPVSQEGLIILAVLIIGMVAAIIPALRVMRVDPAAILSRAG